ncbi:GNAT family N-acetyltransferase [Promineifilum sp.]|uniref:GNAT family N-acetyltransferase n=1 Tax=Promineifilum sp. TaxID=2664178 RepID=UPI0035B129EE
MTPITYTDADEAWRERIGREWGQLAARHMHLDDGFSILALAGNEPVGLIAVVWRDLPAPLPPTVEAYIDIIEVRPAFRRQGIAARLVELAAARARTHGAYQLRAWSSADKVEAIPMWRALGFGLCPATTYPGGQEVRGFFVARPL